MPLSNSGQPYALPADLLTFGMSAAALSSPATGNTAQLAAILAASETCDGFHRNTWTLPLLKWGTDLVRVVCHLASWELICIRGFNPDSVADQLYERRYENAMKLLRDSSLKRYTFDVLDSSPNAVQGLQTPPEAPVFYSPSPINPSTGSQLRGTGSR